MRQYFLDIVILDSHVFFGFAQRPVDHFYGVLQVIQCPLFFGNDFFPVPLVYEYRMNIVGIFVPADGIHIGIEPFSGRKTVFMQCEALPFCERVHDLCILAVLFLNIKRNRALYAV